MSQDHGSVGSSPEGEPAFPPQGQGVATPSGGWNWRFNLRCDACGQFMTAAQPGASWGRFWSYDMSGCPDLGDEIWRCARCTEREGEVGTNCAPAFPGKGRNPPASDGEGASALRPQTDQIHNDSKG